MITTYRILTYLLYPFLIILIYTRMLSKKEHPNRFKEKIFPKFFNVKRNYNLKLIWFHAASIGEFKSIIPIVKELNKSENKFEFLITTVTLSSSYLVEREFGKVNNIHHRFFPIDVKFLIGIFIKLWKPAKIFLVDSEIWPNLIFEAKEKKISIALLNARLTKKSFNRWSIFSNFGKKVFSKFDLCICSNSETSTFLEQLDAKKIYTLGNLKFINTIDLKKIKNLNEEFLQRNRFWFAASTHKGEEVLCLNTHLKLKEKFEKLFTIIAPRHIQRVTEIKKLCDSYGLSSQILEGSGYISGDKEIVILNSFGVMETYFKFSKSVFIGKSTVPKLKSISGQNPIDAAYCGCKIYHGPYVYNFEEVYNILNRNNISIEIKSYQELAKNLILDLKVEEKKSEKISSEMEKISENISKEYLQYINKFINNENI